MRASRSWVALSSVVLTVAACGGSTSPSTGQTSVGAGGAGASVAAGGSSATAGSASSLGGTSSVAGSSSSLGGTSALAGSSSVGGASAGGAIGVGGASGGSPEWIACAAPGDCTLQIDGCCPSCGNATASQFDGVNYADVVEHQMDVCPAAEPCPDCASGTLANLAAFCESNVCQVITVDQDPISACQSDSDCTLRKAACCDCGDTPDNELIAIRSDARAAYESQVCGHGVSGCMDKCAPSHSVGSVATCDQATHHCAVEFLDASTGCPSTLPVPNSPCAVPSGQLCEYGDDVRPGCRTEVECSAGVWNFGDNPNPACQPLAKPGDGGCPTTVQTDGTMCSQPGLICDFGNESVCECSQCPAGPCMPGVMGSWECGAPQPGCPEVANIGQPCAMEGQTCQYGFACGATGMMRVCQMGVWATQPFGCDG